MGMEHSECLAARCGCLCTHIKMLLRLRADATRLSAGGATCRLGWNHMVKVEIKRARRLRRIPDERVDPSDRTPAREEAADWIEQHVVNGGREWQEWTMTEIAERTTYSREHISNSLDAFFEPADSDTATSRLAEMLSPPEQDEDNKDWRDGYQRGFLDGVRAATETDDLEDLL